MNTKPAHLKILLLLVVVVGSYVDSIAQDISILRSTIGMAGSSQSFESDGRRLYSQQSIGQMVVGTYSNLPHIVRQGFIQPTHSFYSGTGAIEGNFYLFPVPVVDNLTLSFPESTPLPVRYRLMDLLGRQLSSGEITVHADVSIEMQDLPAGPYLILLNDAARQYRYKLIKK